MALAGSSADPGKVAAGASVGYIGGRLINKEGASPTFATVYPYRNDSRLPLRLQIARYYWGNANPVRAEASDGPGKDASDGRVAFGLNLEPKQRAVDRA